MYTVGIVGAGPVGLSLARLLLTSSVSSQVSIQIYEKDASRTSRRSLGGTLDLHTSTGLAAIQKMDLWDSFRRYARWDGEELRICDQNGTCYAHQTSAPQIEGLDARPEIDRVRLMEVLLESVPDEIIHWGKELKEVLQRGGRYILHFQDGMEEGPFDLLVGADGAWSKVRHVLTSVRPQYSGIGGVSGAITRKSAGDYWKMVEDMIGNGSNFSFSYNRSVMGQRLGDGSVKVALYQRRPLEWHRSLKKKAGKDQDALKQVLLEEYKDWTAQYQQLINVAEDLWSVPLWELPYGDTFDHKAGITLIGDAAHLQTPFAGEGANAGMRDALDLSAAIEATLKESKDMDDDLRAFEQAMFERAEGVMRRTLLNKDGMYAHDAPYSFLASFTAVAAGEAGFDINKGLLAWIPATKIVYSLVWLWGSFGALRRMIKDRLPMRG